MQIIADRQIPFLPSGNSIYGDFKTLSSTEITNASIKEADALLVRTRTRCDAALLNGSRVRFIGSATIGTDHIDLDYCKQAGITVCNAAGCNAPAVMQYVVTVLAELSARLHKPLETLTLGVIGVGHVGRLVALAAEALGMRVLLNDPPRAQDEGHQGFTELEELLPQADAVSLHVPLSGSTRNMVNERFFDRMQPGAWLINTSRGEVVDESSLLRHRRRLGALALDVWNGEPRINKAILEITDIATPHIAGYSIQGKHQATAMILKALASYAGLNTTADIQALSPSTLPEIMTIDKGINWREALLLAVQKTFPIFETDHELRLKPDNFESIRNNYPLRNDFSAHRISLLQANLELERILQLLGFRL